MYKIGEYRIVIYKIEIVYYLRNNSYIHSESSYLPIWACFVISFNLTFIRFYEKYKIYYYYLSSSSQKVQNIIFVKIKGEEKKVY